VELITELQFGQEVANGGTPGGIEWADELSKAKLGNGGIPVSSRPSNMPMLYNDDASKEEAIQIGSTTVGMSQAVQDMPINIGPSDVGMGQVIDKDDKPKNKKRKKKPNKGKAVHELDFE